MNQDTIVQTSPQLSSAWYWPVVAGLHRPLRHTEDRDSRGDSADRLPRRRDGGSGGCSKRAYPHRFRVRLWRAGLGRNHFARPSAAWLDSSLEMIG
jgi:hypothetical protein